jgi:polysaccharide export outer membrane protein
MIEMKRDSNLSTAMVCSSRACCLGLLIALFSALSLAQQPGASANGSTSTAASSGAESLPASKTDARYRIGPGDVLEVRVLRAPELSREGVRVDQSGMIRMPMLNTDIQAACLTEAELAANIANLYLKYKREPHVEVFVKEFQSQPVAVIGAVLGPAQFKLQRPVRLSELLSFAGGPSETAGQTVQVVHAGGPSLCDKASSANLDDTSGFVSYKLIDTLHAVPEANPFVRPGDLVQVPNADQVYVLGNVLKPLAIPLKEPLTVSKAIAIAGGTAPSTKKDKVRIIRQLPGRGKQEIHIDLKAIEKNQAEDVALLANDIVDVPISGAKSILRSLVGAVVPSVGQLPVRVIP